MKTLAFDTSAAHCAVALLSDDTVLTERCEPMQKGQAERLMVLCEAVLSETGTTWGDLDVIGVGVGPGNFTGIRIAVSAARGLSLSLGIPAIGVPVSAALAFGTDEPVVTSIDARQNRVYVQRTGSPDIEILPIDEIPTRWANQVPTCIGHRSDEIATQLNAHASAPRDPLAVAIGQIARLQSGTQHARPAPLYVRPPDAAPPRDNPPVILSR